MAVRLVSEKRDENESGRLKTAPRLRPKWRKVSLRNRNRKNWIFANQVESVTKRPKYNYFLYRATGQDVAQEMEGN